MSYRRPKFDHPHFIDHKRKAVWMYVASGWPTVMAVPKWMNHYFYDLENYEGRLCSQNYLDTLKNEQKESD